VALVGHTGSGKSTLASLLMGYYPFTQGEIRLDGRPLASLSHTCCVKALRWCSRIRWCWRIPSTPTSRWAGLSEEQVWAVLETVQLAELARGLSDGINTQLGEQGNNLSVGQKQLLALARC
jgi:ATP-binding cassette subfamily B multidrug efflux pump